MSESSLHDRVEEITNHYGRGFKYIVTKSGKKITFSDSESQAKRGMTTLWRSLSRMGKLAQKHDDYDWDWERIDRMLDEVETMLNIWREQVRKHGVRRSTEQRIAQLRCVTGRTPEEATIFRAKADELERELH